MDKVAMGERIRHARKSMGLTQEQLALRLHISDSYMTLVELGKRNISMETLWNLSETLGLSADYLLKGNADHQDISAMQWKGLTTGRSEAEMNAALHMVKEFFKALDDCK